MLRKAVGALVVLIGLAALQGCAYDPYTGTYAPCCAYSAYPGYPAYPGYGYYAPPVTGGVVIDGGWHGGWHGDHDGWRH